MAEAFQGSLLDCGDETWPGPLGSSVRRTALSRGAWIDLRHGWMSGADTLFERLLQVVPWRAERRRMYDRVVDVPRLLCFYDEGEPLPDPALDAALRVLNAHYADELGEPFRTAGLCLYRDGRDSVAWHGDRIGRGATENTMVAIVSLGTPRSLLLRPAPMNGTRRAAATAELIEPTERIEPTEQASSAGRASAPEPAATRGRRAGGSTLRYEPGHGDLLVMGGSCQRTWEHAVPKTARPAGPRISVQFRPRGVR